MSGIHTHEEKFFHSHVNVKIGTKYKVPEKNIGEDKKEYEERATNEIMHSIARLLPKDYRGVYDFVE